MEERKKKGIEWIKGHKTELFVAGISIGTIIVLILKMKNYEMIEEKIRELNKIVKNIQEVPQVVEETNNTEKMSMSVLCEHALHAPHEVRMHLRNLPTGYKPSLMKIEAATKYGLELLPGQTFVEAYHTGGNAA